MSSNNAKTDTIFNANFIDHIDLFTKIYMFKTKYKKIIVCVNCICAYFNSLHRHARVNTFLKIHVHLFQTESYVKNSLTDEISSWNEKNCSHDAMIVEKDMYLCAIFNLIEIFITFLFVTLIR